MRAFVVFKCELRGSPFKIVFLKIINTIVKYILFDILQKLKKQMC